MHHYYALFMRLQYTPLVEKANEDLVHHMILYECSITDPILERHARLAGANCYSPTIPSQWQTCAQPVLTWVRGSKGKLSTTWGQPLTRDDSRKYLKYRNLNLEEKYCIVRMSRVEKHWRFLDNKLPNNTIFIDWLIQQFHVNKHYYLNLAANLTIL